MYTINYFKTNHYCSWDAAC